MFVSKDVDLEQLKYEAKYYGMYEEMFEKEHFENTLSLSPPGIAPSPSPVSHHHTTAPPLSLTKLSSPNAADSGGVTDKIVRTLTVLDSRIQLFVPTGCFVMLHAVRGIGRLLGEFLSEGAIIA